MSTVWLCPATDFPLCCQGVSSFFGVESKRATNSVEMFATEGIRSGFVRSGFREPWWFVVISGPQSEALKHVSFYPLGQFLQAHNLCHNPHKNLENPLQTQPTSQEEPPPKHHITRSCLRGPEPKKKPKRPFRKAKHHVEPSHHPPSPGLVPGAFPQQDLRC